MGKVESIMRITGYQTKNLKAVSTGLCPNCSECANAFGYTEDQLNEFNHDVESCKIYDESSFSWNPCDDCNTSLGGDSFFAHGLDSNNEIMHFKVCYQCMMEINGYEVKS